MFPDEAPQSTAMVTSVVSISWDFYQTLRCHDKILGLFVPPDKGPRPLGPKERDELLVPSGKASTMQTDHLINGEPLWFEPPHEKFKSNHPYI